MNIGQIRRATVLCAAFAVLCGFADVTYDITPSDDATTDTTAINDAIATAAEGTTITLAPGTYKINATISLTNGVTLLGTGYKTCILDAEARVFKFIVIDHASAVLKGVTIANGRSPGHWIGSCVNFGDGGGSLTRCRVTGGKPGVWNYQVYGAIFACSKGQAKIFHCIVDNNEGYQGGGAKVTYGLVYDCLFYKNYASVAGGGIWYQSGSVNVVNCTFAYNSVLDTSSGGGGGVYGQNGELINCLTYGNTCANDKSTGGPDINHGDYSKVKYCASPKGVGSNPVTLTASPFKDEGHDDYRLASSAPSIDAGDAKLTTNKVGAAYVDYDLAELDRVMGSNIDCGCYEYDPNVASVSLSADATSATVARGVTLTAAVGGVDPTGGTFVWTLTPKNGAAVEQLEGNPVVFMPKQYGTYDAKVVFTKGSTSAPDEKADYLFFGPVTNYVSAVEVKDSASPYLSEATAATNIQDAIDVAADGTVIVLMDGTHKLKSGFTVAKGVKLIGSGWDRCTLYGDRTILEGFQNPLAYLDHADARLEGVHVTHVEASKGGTLAASGVAIAGNGGVLANCRVTECTDKYGTLQTRGAVSLSGPASVVTGCLIETNRIFNNVYNTAGGIYMLDGRVDNTVVRGNKGGLSQNLVALSDSIFRGGAGIVAVGGTVLNCTVVDNICPGTEGERSGGIWANNATVRNCIVQGNTVGTNKVGSVTYSTETNVIVSVKSTSGTVTYSTSPVGDLPEGTGNQTGTVALWANSVRPKTSSIAHRAGSVEGYESYLSGVDFYGRARRTESGKIDIGAAQSRDEGTTVLIR